MKRVILLILTLFPLQFAITDCGAIDPSLEDSTGVNDSISGNPAVVCGKTYTVFGTFGPSYLDNDSTTWTLRWSKPSTKYQLEKEIDIFRDTTIGTLSMTRYIDIDDYRVRWTDSTFTILDTARTLADYSFSIFLSEICDTMQLR